MRPNAQANLPAAAPAGHRHRVRKTARPAQFRRPAARIIFSRPRLLLGAVGTILGLLVFSAGAAFAYYLFTDSSSSALAAAATLSAPAGAAESTAATATSGSIPLSWTAPSGTPSYTPTGYVVLRCQGANCTNFAAVTSGPCASATTTSCTDTDPALAPSTTYSYKVEAKLDNWVSAPSAAFTASTTGAAQLAFTTQPPASSQSGASFSVAVTVEDSNGNPVTNGSNRTVALAIFSGTGTKGAKLTCNGVSPKPTATTSAGVATFTNCTIDKAGTGYQLIATSSTLTSGDSSSFSITAGPGTQLAFTAQPSSSQALGTGTFSAAVTVEDSNGNPLTNDNTDPVTLAITGGTGTSGAALSCTGHLTANATSGVASFSGCAIDMVGTGYTLTATSGSLHPATSNTFNITPGTAAQLAFTTQPVSSQSGATIPVAVAVQDSNGNTITTSSRTVNLAITGGTGTNGATLSCSGTKASSGVATFGGCAIDKAGTAYTLTATSGALTPATSNTFNITVGSATQLAFTTQPSSTTQAKGTGTFSATVTVEDSGGNPVTADNGDSVTLAIASGTGTGGATLSCTGSLTATAASGVATFSGCAIDKAGTGYTLTATSGPLTRATSNTLTITAGTASAVNIVSGNNQSATVSTAFASPLTAIVTDANGNPVSGASVTFQAVPASDGASATFAAKGCSSSTKSPVCVVTTKSDGQAGTSTLTANGTSGNYTIVATTAVGTNTLSVTFNEANNS